MVAAGAAFLVVAALRFLALTGFPNDHYLYIAPAQQIRFGEWPSRDFADPGTPLMYAMSAVAQLVLGSPLLAEAVLMSAAFGLAAALTMCAAYRASGRLWIAVAVAAAEVAMFPRSYHYPKLLLYAAGVLAMWSYVDAPSKSRAAVLAACIVVAFLFRHDHAAYLGLAALAAAAAARPGWRGALRRTAHIVVLCAVLVAPYLVYLEVTTGLAAHLVAVSTHGRREARRERLQEPPRFDTSAIVTADNARTWLFYTYHGLPLIALAVVWWRARRERSPAARAEVARIVPVCVLAICVNVALLRNPLDARLPDVAAPACVLAAWLVALTWRAPRGRAPLRLLMVTVAILTLAGVNAVGSVSEQLNRAGVRYPARIGEFLRERRAQLERPFSPRQYPSRIVENLMPFLEYVGRCTEPQHRLFVAGDAPEIYVFADRPFAGGQPALREGLFDSDRDQRRLVSRLRQQQVPLALVIQDSDAASYPLVMHQLEVQFRPLTELPLDGRPNVLVRVSRQMTPRSTDAATGLPCFR